MDQDAYPQLTGKCILVVEDEPMISMLIEDMLFDLGCTVVGPAGELAYALRLAEDEEFDAAVIDVQLGPEDSFPLAEVLHRERVPFAFATGYGQGSFPYDAPVLKKPYAFKDVAETLVGLLAQGGRP